MNLGYKQEGELQLKKYIYVDYENMGNIKNLIPIDGQYFFSSEMHKIRFLKN